MTSFIDWRTVSVIFSLAGNPTQTLTAEFSPLSPINMPKKSCEFVASLRKIYGNESRSIRSAWSRGELPAVTHGIYMASHMACTSRHTWHIHRVISGMRMASHLACTWRHTWQCIWRHTWHVYCVTPGMYMASHLTCIWRHTWHVHGGLPAYMIVN